MSHVESNAYVLRIILLFGGEGIPALGAEWYFSTVTGDHGTSEIGFGYVADQFYVGQFLYLFVIM